MIFYYILILSLPLVSHPLFGRTIGGVTVVKYLGLVCLLCALLHLAQRRRMPGFLATGQARAFLLFVALAGVSYLFSGSRMNTGESVFVIYSSQVLFFVITLALVDSELRLRRVLLAAVGSVALASLYLLREWQLVGMNADYRPGYVTGDPNFFAASAVLGLPLAFWFAMEGQNRWERLYCLACLVLGLGAVTLAASRGGFLGLAVAMALVAWRSRRRKRNLGLVAAAFLLVFCAAPSFPVQRFFRPHGGDVYSKQVRLQLWEAGLRMVRQHPLGGVGLGNFNRAVAAYGNSTAELHKMAHNTYIEMAAELGLPGLLCFLAILYFSCRSLGRVRSLPAQLCPPALYQASLGVQAGLLGFAVATFFVSAQFLKLFWLMVFLSMCLPPLTAADPARRKMAAQWSRTGGVTRGKEQESLQDLPGVASS